jgi:hypothetical protein
MQNPILHGSRSWKWKGIEKEKVLIQQEPWGKGEGNKGLIAQKHG